MKGLRRKWSDKGKLERRLDENIKRANFREKRERK